MQFELSQAGNVKKLRKFLTTIDFSQKLIEGVICALNTQRNGPVKETQNPGL